MRGSVALDVPVAVSMPAPTPAMSSPARERLFVYGTLRTGGPASAMLHGCQRIEERQVRGTLYDFGAFPALVPDQTGLVSGELWECPPETIRALDTYEGVAEGLFARVRLPLDDGEDAWVYVAGPRLLDGLSGRTQVDGGSWSAS